MKTIPLAAFAALILLALFSQGVNSAPNKADQPVDNGVRLAEVVRVIDGDTLVMDIYLGDGIWTKNRHVRLKDVYCYEIATQIGITERDELAKLVGNPDAPLAVQMFGKDGFGRLIGVVWCNNKNVNEAMKLLPQGGTGTKPKKP